MNRAVNPIPVTIALMNRRRRHLKDHGLTPAFWTMTQHRKDELKYECMLSPSFNVMNANCTKAFGLPIVIVEEAEVDLVLVAKEDMDGER